MEIIIANLFATVAVYSLPIIIYRYFVKKQPIPPVQAKKIVIIYAICAFLVMTFLIELFNPGATATRGGAIIVWSVINYKMLTKGKTRAPQSKEPEPITEKNTAAVRQPISSRSTEAVPNIARSNASPAKKEVDCQGTEKAVLDTLPGSSAEKSFNSETSPDYWIGRWRVAPPSAYAPDNYPDEFELLQDNTASVEGLPAVYNLSENELVLAFLENDNYTTIRFTIQQRNEEIILQSAENPESPRTCYSRSQSSPIFLDSEKSAVPEGEHGDTEPNDRQQEDNTGISRTNKEKQTDAQNSAKPIIHYCRRCGSRIPADSIFCSNCGFRVQDD